MIDDAFYVQKQRWGTFVSVDSQGTPMVTSATEEECISVTRWYMKAKQEGFPEPVSSYDSTVGGKL